MTGGKILVICGATATGKSALAVDCAKALGTEIISADSQLVYRGLNIGTAKPTLAERGGIMHHMMDIVDADKNFSVSDYEAAAIPIVDRLLCEGKIPIICGGTGFYINSILYKNAYGNAAANAEIRDKYAQMLAERGKEYIFELLKEVDPQSAAKLHVNDVKRVVRALEIYEITGKKKSEQNDGAEPRYNYLAISIDYPRAMLYKRIDCRVDMMFNAGLVEEVKGLLKQGLSENAQSLQAIGYKEVVECLKKGDNESTMRDIIKLNTHHYAKRQITFFKKMQHCVRLPNEQATQETIMELLENDR